VEFAIDRPMRQHDRPEKELLKLTDIIWMSNKNKKAIPVSPRRAGMGFKPINQIDSQQKADYFILRANYFEM
tara:strand:- start:3954 stop:4169 length:216 start_codon:yes stop_codon:yes gene_type:complete